MQRHSQWTNSHFLIQNLTSCCISWSSQSGPPPWRICSRNQTRLIKALSVHVTTKHPWKISDTKLSLWIKKCKKKNVISFLCKSLIQHASSRFQIYKPIAISLLKKGKSNTYVESMSSGSVSTEETEPVKRQRYILQAVSGTTPSHATATNV